MGIHLCFILLADVVGFVGVVASFRFGNLVFVLVCLFWVCLLDLLPVRTTGLLGCRGLI